MKKVSYNLPVDLIKELKLQAVKEDTTQKELIIKYLKQGLKQND